MFSKRILPTSFVTLFLFALCACVSINVQNSKYKKSTEVTYTDPAEPFEDINVAHVDKSWRNTKDGSTISYFSDCSDPTDPSLQNIFKGVISSIDDVTVIESSEITFNQRAALHSTVEGKVDGVIARFELLLFKKNSCNYILTYTAIPSAFGTNQKIFKKFVNGFRVP